MWLHLVLPLLLLVSPGLTYKLSPTTGRASVGAYDIQPGRCSLIERSLGHSLYGLFFTPAIPTPFPATSPVSDLDSTSLCAFNPSLTQGYGSGFNDLQLYLVYARCLYGTNDMRVICGTADGRGKPTGQYWSVVQATCPRGTRCKNLCATKERPDLTSKWAKDQVQLAQCVEERVWEGLTDMYRPRAGSPQNAGKVDGRERGKVSDTIAPSAPPTARGEGEAAEGGFASLSRLQLPTSPANAPEGQEAGQETAQEAPTPKGFRKRSLGKSGARGHVHRSRGH